MAPVHDFRHVELDKIGRGKRIVKPPGGECSNIFGNGVVIQNGYQTPRKTKNYMQSNIFTPDSPDSSVPSTPGTPKGTPILDTQDRLFGQLEESLSPRKVVNRQRSSIFEDEVDAGARYAKTTPTKRPMVNPITGTPISGQTNGVNGTNGFTNGFTNGHTNGHTNGDLSPMNGGSPRVRNPPGGKSSGIF